MADRFRDWTCIVYPDSAPDNWIDILKKEHLCFGVSPLHDSDVNGDDSEKKAHWHLYIKYQGVKSYDQVCDDIRELNCTIPKNVKNPVGLVRYFIHLDNPEKHQYDIGEIVSYGGFDKLIEEAFKLGITDANAILSDIQDWILNNQIDEYEDLWAYSIDLPRWRYVLNMYNCHSVHRLITSIRNRKDYAKHSI